MKILLFIFLLGITSTYAQVCPSDSTTSKVLNANGDLQCFYLNGSSVTVDSQATADEKTKAQAAIDAQNNLPQNKFNTNLFVEELAVSNLVTDPNVLPYYAVIKDLTSFKNFQGLANIIAGLLLTGKLTQDEVNSLDSILENQSINMDSYNSEVNVSY